MRTAYDKLCSAVTVALLAAAGAALVVAPVIAHSATVTGNAALTTDYVWRGTSQTQGDPAVQAGFKVAGESGFYGSIWGSNVEFAPETHASSEFDFVAGWAGALSDDWALDVNLTHYRYPSTTVDLNWTELNGTVTWLQNYWLQLAYSNEVFGSEEDGIYALVGARFPINDAFRLEAAAAYHHLDDLYDDSYAHAQLSAIWAFKAPDSNRNVELRLTAHGTDSAAKDIFGDNLAGSRIEAAIQATF